jgi:hypothetical protein
MSQKLRSPRRGMNGEFNFSSSIGNLADWLCHVLPDIAQNVHHPAADLDLIPLPPEKSWKTLFMFQY